MVCTNMSVIFISNGHLDGLKTELERVEEEAMMDELVQLVMKRDMLLWQHDEAKTRLVI